MKKLRRYILLITLAFSSFAMPKEQDAGISTVSQSQISESGAISNQQQVELGTKGTPSTCPAPTDLVKVGLIWGTRDGAWKTPYKSFIQHINKFTGAHWVGVKVGKIICTYQGLENLTFPLMIENNVFVLSPSGANWTDDVNGVKNCRSNDINDCPFGIVSIDSGKTDLDSLIKLKSKPAEPEE